MLEVTVELDEVGPFLQEMMERVSDLSEPIGLVLELGLEDARATIRAGGPDFGWPSHSPWTFKADKALGGRTRVGMGWETGRMIDSLVPGGAGNVFEKAPLEGRAGTALTSPRTGYPYAAGFEEGRDKSFKIVQFIETEGAIAEFNSTPVPPRALVYWHEEEFSEYERIFGDHVMGEA